MRKKGYRRIYKQYYGEIPIDSENRTYDIHHDDGDSANNHPWNLLAVSIDTHYWIHWLQGDWAQCQAIALRMETPPNSLSALSKKRVANGTHHLLSGEIQRKSAKERIANGTHNLLDGEISRRTQRQRIADGTFHFLGGAIQSRTNRRRVADRTHHFFNQLKNGTHASQKIRTCPHCGKTGKGPIMLRYHFNKCKVV